MESYLSKLLIEICLKKNIILEFFSYKYIAKLTKGDKVRYIIGNSFGNNSSSSAKIATDKCCTYEILKNYDVPVIEHNFINSLNSNLDFTKKYNYDVVIKPNKGAEGKSVEHLTNLQDIKKMTNKIVRYEKAAAICPFYDIKNEYRTFYLDGQCLLTYDKKRPYVIGDGKNNVHKLIKSQNLKHINIKEMSKEELEYVPIKNEEKRVSWKHNLSFGAKPVIVDDKLKLDKIHKLVESAGKAIDITFASIDIIELHTGELMVLEINSAVTMTKFVEYEKDGEKFAEEIYGKAIDKLFE
jgi:glutathione synthase/RimK-type ligase-like ATP-grasp enzyme